MTQRLLYLLPLMLFTVVVGYFLWGLSPSHKPREVPSAMIDKSVPAFDLPALEPTGRPGLSSADLTQGQVTLVNFFASWCVPCRVEHPQLIKLAEDPTIQVVGINFRDDPVAGARWLEDLGNPYTRIGVDARGRTAIDWGVSGVPETYIVDRQGRIRHQHIGPILPHELEEKIRPLIEALQ